MYISSTAGSVRLRCRRRYVREEEWDSIMCPVPESDIAPHLHKRMKVAFPLNLSSSFPSYLPPPPPFPVSLPRGCDLAAACLAG